MDAALAVVALLLAALLASEQWSWLSRPWAKAKRRARRRGGLLHPSLNASAMRNPATERTRPLTATSTASKSRTFPAERLETQPTIGQQASHVLRRIGTPTSCSAVMVWGRGDHTTDAEQ